MPTEDETEDRVAEVVEDLRSLNLSPPQLLALLKHIIGRDMTREEWQTSMTLPVHELHAFALKIVKQSRQ